MKRLSRTQGILVFYLFDLALLLLLVISFMPFMKKGRPVSRDTALLNPSSKEKALRIVLSKKEDDGLFRRKVTLERTGGIWLGFSSDGNDEFLWPADIQSVERLLDLSCSIVKSYEKSKSRKDWGAFGLKEKDAFSLSFYDSSGKDLSSLYFGGEDSLTNRIYVRSSAEDTVYEIDDAIAAFLNVEESFWADPFIYPQCLTGLARQEADAHLRRGRLENVRPREGLAVDYREKIYFGNGAVISFNIYKKNQLFIVIPTLTPGPAASEPERKAIESINYRYSISGTTLERLLEECRQAE
ncbi:MAG: DUF4340 domain-containing protein [Treponema sp.]|nr:DUF4340 domain-containing protein [Treponema sp.]